MQKRKTDEEKEDKGDEDGPVSEVDLEEAHQNEVSERLKKLGKMMTELKAMAPVLGAEAMGALGQAKQASRAAGGFLSGGDAVGAGQAQADVLSALEAGAAAALKVQRQN